MYQNVNYTYFYMPIYVLYIWGRVIIGLAYYQIQYLEFFL